jgi:hypothetical protein
LVSQDQVTHGRCWYCTTGGPPAMRVTLSAHRLLLAPGVEDPSSYQQHQFQLSTTAVQALRKHEDTSIAPKITVPVLNFTQSHGTHSNLAGNAFDTLPTRSNTAIAMVDDAALTAGEALRDLHPCLPHASAPNNESLVATLFSALHNN